MKPILINELIKLKSTEEQVSVTIDGKKMEGWEIAKPLNYENLKFIDRFKMSIKVLQGKAIAVQFFSDLSNSDKIKYVKTKIN